MSKKTLAVILKFSISIGLIFYVVQSIDLHSVWSRMLEADALYLVLSGLVIFLQILIGTLRWRAIMVGLNTILAYGQILRIYLIGLFFNQVLPSSVGGDAVRIYKSFRAGLTIREAVHSIMLERVATVLGLLMLAAVASPFFQRQGNASEANIMVSFSVMMLAIGVCGTLFLMFLDRLPRKFRSWRFVKAMSEFALDTRRIFLSPHHAAKALGWSMLGHFAISVAVFFIAKALNLNVSILDCMVLIPPVMLVTTLPISIAGWGVREGAMVTAFAMVGVQANDALALSFLFGVSSIIFAIPGGVLWLLMTDKKVDVVSTEQPL